MSTKANTLKRVFTGIVVAGAMVSAPVIPSNDITFDQNGSYAFCYHPYEEVQVPIVVSTAEGTSTVGFKTEQQRVNPDLPYIDRDGNGLICLTVFKDASGGEHWVQASDSEYKKKEFKPIYRESLLASLSPIAHAAISFSTADAAKTDAAAASLTFSHSNAVGGVNVLFGGHTKETEQGISVTYAAVSASLLVEKNGTDSGYMSAWQDNSGATGANNVVVTKSGTQRVLFGYAETVLGANTASPFGATGSSQVSPAAASLTTDVVTTVANSWVVSANYANGGNPTVTATGANQTARATALSGDGERVTGGDQTTTSPGTYTTQYDTSPNEVLVTVAVEVKVAAGAAFVQPPFPIFWGGWDGQGW